MNIIIRGKLAVNDEGEYYLTDKEGRMVFLNSILEGFLGAKADVSISIEGWEKGD